MLLTLSKNDFLLVLFGFSFPDVWILCFVAFYTVWLIKSRLIAVPFLDLISGILISVSLDLADVSLTFILCIPLLIASKNLIKEYTSSYTSFYLMEFFASNRASFIKAIKRFIDSMVRFSNRKAAKILPKVSLASA